MIRLFSCPCGSFRFLYRSTTPVAPLTVVAPRGFIAALLSSMLVLLVSAEARAVDCFDMHSIPRFYQNLSRPQFHSIRSGDWESASTWDTNTVPTADAVVHIDFPDRVTIRSQVAVGNIVAVHGSLVFDPSRNTKLAVTTLLVLEDQDPPGLLQIGTSAQPVDASVTAEIVFNDESIDRTNDPRQFGTGLIACGRVSMYGAERTPTFLPLALGQEAHAGSSTLSLSASVSGWRAGDRLLLPDSRHVSHDTTLSPGPYAPEEAVVSSVSSDGRTITLQAPLVRDHLGGRNGAGTLEFMPDVGNLSRNIVLRSANPSGTRGHAMFVHMGDYRLHNTLFKDLGRTTDAPLDDSTFDANGNTIHYGSNQRGRYSVHFHHVTGPDNPTNTGYQYELVGCAVADGDPSKWAITVHNSHWGLIKDNVVYKITGAAVMTEDGNEYFNEFRHNFIVRVFGRNGSSDRDGDGRSPDAFWLYGPSGYIMRDNVVANVDNFGYQIWDKDNLVRVPKFRGANVAVDGEYDVVNTATAQIRDFTDNQAYASSGGFKIWSLGNGGGYGAGNSVGPSVVQGLKMWHVNVGSYLYPTTQLVFQDFVSLGDAFITKEFYEHGDGIEAGDYQQEDITCNRCRIEGQKNGIVSLLDAPNYRGTPSVTIKDSYFRNHGADIVLNTQNTPGTGSDIAARTVEIRNCKFDPLPGKQLYSIAMSYNGGTNNSDLTQGDRVFVYDYQQIPGNNFRVHYFEQLPEFIMPQTNLAWREVASPVADETNQQNWANRGIAIGGEVAPSRETLYPEIYGLVTATPSLPAQAPVIFDAGVTFSAGSPNQAVITWWTNKPASSLVQSASTPFPPVSDSTPVVRHSITVPNLQYATEYQYRITSANADGSRTTDNFYFWTPHNPSGDTAAPPIEELRWQTDGQMASINWRSSTEGSTSQVEYGFDTSYGQRTPLDTRLIGGYDWHIVNITGLQQGRLYHARVRAKDPTGNEALSGDFTFFADGRPFNVDAGPDQSVALPNSVTVSGSASDDGLPNPPGRLTPHWDRVQGPPGSTMTFGNDAASSTSVRFDKPGAYTLAYSVTDGQLSASDTMTVTVLASGTPTVSITAPRAGATLVDTVSVTANASDDTGVAGVQFLLDGASLGSLTTLAPYSVSWDTRSVADGTHRLSAVVRDISGNTSTASDVVVRVNNSGSTTPPTITRQPANTTVNEGQRATFVVRAGGAGTFSYQWQYQPPGGNFTDITGANDSVYDTLPTIAADSGTALRCVVSNGAGSVTSDPATLTVVPGTNHPQGGGPVELEMIEGEMDVTLTHKGKGLKPFKMKLPIRVRNVSLPSKSQVTLTVTGPGRQLIGAANKRTTFKLKKGGKTIKVSLKLKTPGQFLLTVRLDYPGGQLTKQMLFVASAPG